MNWIKRFWSYRLRVRLVIAAVVVLVAFGTGFYYYQLTTTSYETLVFNAVTGPTLSPVPTTANPGTTCNTANSACAVQNIGTGAHQVSYCITGGSVSTFAIELEGSNDNAVPPGNFIQISNRDTTLSGTAGCGVLEAAGYFTYLRLNLITLTGASPKITAWYSGLANAIPGGGLTIAQKASQPITQVPALGFENTALSSTPVNIGSAQATLFLVSVFNPNASVVFITVAGMPTTLEWEIAANTARDIPLGPGIASSAATTPTIECSTALNGTGAPGTGCVVMVLFKPFQTMNSQLSSTGTVQGSGGQIGN